MRGLCVAGLMMTVASSPLAGQQAPDAARDEVGATALSPAAWLAGCWEATSATGRSVTEEQWMAPSGGLMVGMSRSVRDGAARGYELLTIRAGKDGGLVYRAAPSGQAVTDFPARAVAPGRLEFVNAEHAFPKKIVYTLLEEDLTEAAVFGEVDASEPAFTLRYRGVSCPVH